MENSHKPVMINEIVSFLPSKKSINVMDATFGEADIQNYS